MFRFAHPASPALRACQAWYLLMLATTGLGAPVPAPAREAGLGGHLGAAPQHRLCEGSHRAARPHWCCHAAVAPSSTATLSGGRSPRVAPAETVLVVACAPPLSKGVSVMRCCKATYATGAASGVQTQLHQPSEHVAYTSTHMQKSGARWVRLTSRSLPCPEPAELPLAAECLFQN